MNTSVYQILEQVAATSSRKEKEAILSTHKDNTLLKRVCKMAYDKQILFWMSELPPLDMSLLEDATIGVDLETALNQIEDNICNRKLTGGAAEQFVGRLQAHMNEEDRSVLGRVISKDLRSGFSASTANKTWKDLIPEPKFMLAETDDKNIVYPAISQLKADGTRVKMMWDGYKAVFVTRNGNDVETHGLFDSFAQTHLTPGDRIDGELVAVDAAGKALDRKTGNGIVNKAVKGTISKEEAEQLRFVVWDLENHPGGYQDRLSHLTDLILKSRTHRIYVIETRRVADKKEALAHFKEMRARGEEGTLLKNANAPWQGKRTFDCVKFKAEYEAEFRVTGFDYGTGKYADKVGALNIESEDGHIKCDVGIFKDFPSSVREEWLTDLPTIVTVMYNERITQKGATTESLFLPRVTAVRHDKDKANTWDEIVEIEKGTYR